MNNSLKGTNIFLIGMMGAGKTSVGRSLARQLSYRFFDTDLLIERVKGKPVIDIFQQEGEADFRQVETQVLAEVAAYTRSVIATGGGIVLQRQNWSYLHHGLVVWLDVAIEQLQVRLQRDSSRPLLQETNLADKLCQLLAERESLYAQADVRIRISHAVTPTQVATLVMQELPKVLKPELSPPTTSE